jgi:type I restriction enzyme R subunit
VKGEGGSALVDLVAIVKHEITPEEPLVPVAQQVEVRYREWLAEKEHLGQEFTEEQMTWLNAIKDHVATSLAVDVDDLQEVPFAQMGGLGKAHQLFGDELPKVMEELNGRLVA